MALSKTETLKEKKARLKAEERVGEIWRGDIKTVASTLSGRKLLWTVLGVLKVGADVDTLRTDTTQQNIGKQKAGHWLRDQILDADENIWFTMMTESKKGEYNVR